VKQHFFSQGAHSSDETGGMGENNFPEWAKLFMQYFEADSSKPLKMIKTEPNATNVVKPAI